MFDKSLLLLHLSETQVGSPIMQSERDKFGVAGRAATNIAASTPAATELVKKRKITKRYQSSRSSSV
jgi:hypothetical protein